MMRIRNNLFRPFQGKLNLFVTLILTLTILSSSCGGDDDGPPEPTPQEVAEALLLGSWSLDGGSILIDGVDVTSKYDGFTATIGEGSFSTTNSGGLFPAVGTWQWSGASDSEFVTGSGKSILVTALTATSFKFSFAKTTGNVPAGIPGEYVISLTK